MRISARVRVVVQLRVMSLSAPSSRPTMQVSPIRTISRQQELHADRQPCARFGRVALLATRAQVPHERLIGFRVTTPASIRASTLPDVGRRRLYVAPYPSVETREILSSERISEIHKRVELSAIIPTLDAGTFPRSSSSNHALRELGNRQLAADTRNSSICEAEGETCNGSRRRLRLSPQPQTLFGRRRRRAQARCHQRLSYPFFRQGAFSTARKFGGPISTESTRGVFARTASGVGFSDHRASLRRWHRARKNAMSPHSGPMARGGLLGAVVHAKGSR